MSSNNLRRTGFLTAFAAAALLSGCGSLGGVLGGGDRGPYDRGPYDDGRSDDGRYDQSFDSVRGTVERVDTVNRVIVVDGEGTTYRNDLRNGNGDEIVLYYDDRTTVEHQGRTYRPQDLESGDRIVADVEQSGSRLMVEDIEVLYDVSGGTGSTGDRYGDDDRYDDRYADDARLTEVRGRVRAVDTRDRTVEIERSTAGNSFSTGDTYGGGVVEVHYDSSTVVEFQGRRYAPENLERGDLVEVELRDQGGRLHAEEILVLADSRAGR